MRFREDLRPREAVAETHVLLALAHELDGA